MSTFLDSMVQQASQSTADSAAKALAERQSFLGMPTSQGVLGAERLASEVAAKNAFLNMPTSGGASSGLSSAASQAAKDAFTNMPASSNASSMVSQAGKDAFLNMSTTDATSGVASQAAKDAFLNMPTAGDSALAKLGINNTATAAGAAESIAADASVAANTAAKTAGTAGTAAADGAITATTTVGNAATKVPMLAQISSKLTSLLPGEMAVNISMGSLAAGASVAMAGLAASGWVDSKDIAGQNSAWDRGISGGIEGAGLGAAAAIGLGLASGPVGWAALGGAALFSVSSLLWGEDKSDKEQMQSALDHTNHTIENLLTSPQFGVDAETARMIRLQVAAATSFYMDNNDKAGLDQYLKGLSSTVPSFLMQAAQNNAATKQQMAQQAVYGPVFSAMLDRSTKANDVSYQSKLAAFNNVTDPVLRATLIANAGTEYSANADLHTAYAQQIAGTAGTTAAQTSIPQVPATVPATATTQTGGQQMVRQYTNPNIR